MELTITTENLSKHYGKKEVLKDLSFTLEQHKIYGLIGRNGIGKTTLLSLLSGQNRPSSGKVLLGGAPVWENEKALSHICFSREISQMYMFGKNTMKAKEYLRIAALFYPHWDKEYADRLTSLFGLEPKKRIDQMSKGMLSMLTIITALASKADFTFLDEPVAGLDVAARDQFYKLLNEEYIATNRTFVISTHIIEEAANLLEEIIILNHAQIAYLLPTEELLARGFSISGKADRVEAIIAENQAHLTVLEKESIGAGETVLLFADSVSAAEQIAESLPHDLAAAPLSLQKLFFGLTQ